MPFYNIYSSLSFICQICPQKKLYLKVVACIIKKKTINHCVPLFFELSYSYSQEIEDMGKRNKNKSAMKTTDNNVKKKDDHKPKIPFHKAKELSDLVSNLFNGEY